MFKKHDLIIFAAAAVLAAAALLMYFTCFDTPGLLVRVSVDSVIVGTYPLNSKTGEVTITEIIGYTGGHCTMRTGDGYASMESAECPDHICVRHSKISRTGECIICMPNRVILEIISPENTSATDSDNNVDAISE